MERLRRLALPERTVRILIDGEKCLGPLACGKCLKGCPSSVFITFPRARERGKVCGEWGLVANDTLCWGCGVCLKVCPTKAITLHPLEDSGSPSP